MEVIGSTRRTPRAASRGSSREGGEEAGVCGSPQAAHTPSDDSLRISTLLRNLCLLKCLMKSSVVAESISI